MAVVATRKIAPGVSQLLPGPFGPVGRFIADPLAFLVEGVTGTATSSGCGPGPT